MTIHFAYAAVLYYGGTLVREESMKPEEDREIDYGKVFTSVTIIVMFSLNETGHREIFRDVLFF